MSWPLRKTSEEYAALDEAHRALYCQADDGSYVATAECSDGTVIHSVPGLLTAHERTSEELRARKRATPEAMRALVEKQAMLDAARTKREREQAELPARYAAELEEPRGKLAAIPDAIADNRAGWNMEKWDDQLDQAVLAVHGDPAHGGYLTADLLRPFLRKFTKPVLDDGGRLVKLAVVDSAGIVQLLADGRPKPVTVYIEELKRDYPDVRRLFPREPGTGMSGMGSG